MGESASEVLASHQWTFDNRYYCICGELVDYQSAVDGAAEAAMSAHVLDALRAAGFAVVALPDAQPQSDLYDVHFDVLSDDEFMTGPRTPRVCVDMAEAEIYSVCTPSSHITPAEARSFAAALLAAANAAEAG